MLRRRHKKGDWLAVDDITGITRYASQMTTDWQGNKVYKGIVEYRNPQDFVYPLGDPYPLPWARPAQPQPEAELCLPIFIGNTNVPFPTDSPGAQVYDVGIGEMEIGYSFCVR